jgi:glycosyltransferase involved in cell wall biosynthesis
VDISHFARARAVRHEPTDQRDIPHPRVGFCGVIDERMDRELLGAVAAARPAYQFLLIGPVAKIDESSLPRAANIHYLGMKPYTDLPTYFAGWDVAVMPFAHNAATRYISPTKTPEYLAAGCPVVSTSIRDVVCPYGERRMVFVADTVADFAAAIDTALGREGQAAVARADELLASLSWDRTWAGMNRLVCAAEAQHADLDVGGEVSVAHIAQH